LPRAVDNLFDKESARRRRLEQIGLGYGSVEPLHHLPTVDDRAVPLLIERDFGVRRDGDDAVAGEFLTEAQLRT